MEIGDRTAPEFGCEIAIGRDGIGVVDLIETPSGRQFHRDEAGRSRSCDRVHDRQKEGRSALNAAAPLVGPQIGVCRKKLHRSEEHTSELQSLMRISYAVLRWNNKRTKYPHP